MRTVSLLAALPASLLALSACMMMPPQGSGTGSSSMQSSASGGMNEPTTTTPAAGAGESQEPAKTNTPVPTSIEVHSDCPQTLPLFIGEKPKYGSGTKTSIGSNTTTSFPRKSDGTQTIWIIDDSENGVASVKVTPETRRVEIDRGCKNITSR